MKQGANTGVVVRNRRWLPPPPGWVRVNVDTATFMQTESVGIGSVIQDENGSLVRARSKKIDAKLHPRSYTPERLKLWD